MLRLTCNVLAFSDTATLLLFFLGELYFCFRHGKGNFMPYLILAKGILLPASFQRRFSPALVAFPCEVEQRKETYILAVFIH